MKRTECKTEQEFKMWYIASILRAQYEEVFCIETEETVRGFPDVMCIKKDGRVVFFEFKYTDAKKIEFKPSQSAFYKAHPKLNIWVIAYKAKTDEIIEFPVWDMSTREGDKRYYMDSKNRVAI